MAEGLRCVITGLVFTLLPLAAAADKTDEDAKMQFQQGVELYKEGAFDQAAVAFARAYELKPNYKILFNIGQAESENKHYAKALEAYVHYLAEGGSAVPHDRVASVKTEIKRLNALVGMVVIDYDVKGVLVFVDEKRQGETPLSNPVFVDVGDHEVVLKDGDRELHREVVTVAGGQRVEVRVATGKKAGSTVPAAAVAEKPLTPAMQPVPEREQPEKANEAVAPTEEPRQPPAVEPEDASKPEDKPKRLWTWVTAGVAGGVGIVGGIIGGVSISRKNDFEDECGDGSCPESKESDREEVKSLSLAADVLYGVAGAAAVAAIVLFFVEPGMGEKEGAVALSPAASADGVRLVVSGGF